MRDFMVQLGKDDLKGRHYPRGYAMWTVQHNYESTKRIVTLRRSFHQSEPCEDQNKYICQRPAAALEGSESLGKIYYVSAKANCWYVLEKKLTFC